MLNVDWSQLRLVVFDVDGTLYDQRKLRAKMTLLLLRHFVAHPADIGLIRIISTYRRCREELAEEECSDIGRLQFERPARKLGISSRVVQQRVAPWIDEKPLSLLRKCRYPGVEHVFAKFRDRGWKLAILSDYPAQRKVEALGLEADLYASAVDPSIDRLKPHPAGLAFIMQQMGVEAGATLMVGDRDDRDGECARRLEVPYLIRADSPDQRDGAFRSFLELLEI